MNSVDLIKNFKTSEVFKSTKNSSYDDKYSFNSNSFDKILQSKNDDTLKSSTVNTNKVDNNEKDHNNIETKAEDNNKEDLKTEVTSKENSNVLKSDSNDSKLKKLDETENKIDKLKKLLEDVGNVDVNELITLLSSMANSKDFTSEDIKSQIDKFALPTDLKNSILDVLTSVKDLLGEKDFKDALGQLKDNLQTLVDSKNKTGNKDFINEIVNVLKDKVEKVVEPKGNFSIQKKDVTINSVKVEAKDNVKTDESNSKTKVNATKVVASETVTKATVAGVETKVNDILDEQASISSEKTEDSKVAKLTVLDGTSDLKIEKSSNKNSIVSILNDLTQGMKKAVSSESNENMSSGKEKDDNKFLNKLISSDDTSDKNDKTSKAVLFMNQFVGSNDVKAEDVSPLNITINKGTVVADIIKSVKFMDASGIKDLTVKLNPKELGAVIISLTLENGVMKANISTSNKDAYNLVNANLQDMNNSLRNENIKIHSFDVNIYNEDPTFFSGGNKQNHSEENQQNRNGSKNSISGLSSISEEQGDIDVQSIYGNSNVNTLA